VRYAVHDGDNLFILFDDIHDPTFLDAGGSAGLDWLKATLDAAHEKRVFFFGHVPPRNTAAWWPDGTGTKVDGYRSKMAALLSEHHITAAFFGHEHFQSYLADTGGFPMFVAAISTPLLVEIADDQVRYRWLKSPLAADPLAQVSDAISDRAVQRWLVAAIPPGRKLVGTPPQLDPQQPIRLDDGSTVSFEQILAPTGDVAVSQFRGIQPGGQIIAIAEVPGESTWAQHLRIRSGLPGTAYFNQLPLGRIAGNPERWNTWLLMAARDRPNRATVVFDVTDPNARFAFVPYAGP
jgi:hypothetical protein